jgi:arabinofuranosyltransferase
VAKDSLNAFLGWAALAFFVVAVLRRGWISDDAFITMRAVDHFISGRGFVYNAGERVLGFTNPLWALLLTVPYLVIRDPYLAPIVGSVLVSTLFAAILVFRSSPDCRVGALLLTALCFSRCFVDFSTSGLENPLVHLLLLLFYVEFFKKEGFSIQRLSLWAALSVVNRFDTLPLLLLPLVLSYRTRASVADRRAILKGWSPAILWFTFAIVYYGFPFPNTAYAKLNAEIPRLEMARQGLSYLVDALVNDPQTIIMIAAALVLLSVRRKLSASIRVGFGRSCWSSPTSFPLVVTSCPGVF